MFLVILVVIDRGSYNRTSNSNSMEWCNYSVDYSKCSVSNICMHTPMSNSFHFITYYVFVCVLAVRFVVTLCLFVSLLHSMLRCLQFWITTLKKNEERRRERERERNGVSLLFILQKIEFIYVIYRGCVRANEVITQDWPPNLVMCEMRMASDSKIHFAIYRQTFYRACMFPLARTHIWQIQFIVFQMK